MHICVNRLSITCSDNGLEPDWHQAIVWTSAGILLIGPLGTNFSEILIEILTFSFMKMRLKVSSATWRPFCLSLNVLNGIPCVVCLYHDVIKLGFLVLLINQHKFASVNGSRMQQWIKLPPQSYTPRTFPLNFLVHLRVHISLDLNL